MKLGNLYSDIPDSLPEELFEQLSTGEGAIKIERIVSRGHSSPPEFWYDQKSTEWVLLLKGEAVLQFADDNKDLSMKPGDWLEIPPGQKHRVTSTSNLEDTVWLAIHWE